MRLSPAVKAWPRDPGIGSKTLTVPTVVSCQGMVSGILIISQFLEQLLILIRIVFPDDTAVPSCSKSLLICQGTRLHPSTEVPLYQGPFCGRFPTPQNLLDPWGSTGILWKSAPDMSRFTALLCVHCCVHMTGARLSMSSSLILLILFILIYSPSLSLYQATPDPSRFLR